LAREVYNTPSSPFNFEDFQKLTKEKADNFYKIRQQNLGDSIEHTLMSKNAKEKLLARDAQIKAPFIYDYTYGYTHFDSVLYTLGILICFVLAICLAPIFSGEYTSGTDQLILSSKHGKKQLILAKFFTGITLSTLVCLILIFIIYVLSMLILGTDGRNAPIQLFMPMCPYPLTMGQTALVYTACILSASLLTAAISILLSSKLKSPFGVIIIVTVLIVTPLFIKIDKMFILSYNLLNLLPTKMLDFMNVTSSIQYEFFGLVVPPYLFMPIFALLASIVLIPFAYRGFKNHQIG
jgi:ABC-type transport system involved in multi-copper enzyme maturation permease subunit